jgi:threonine aldolase
VAAGALYALQNHRVDLQHDVRWAKRFAEGLQTLQGTSIDPTRVETNIVRFEVVPDAGVFVTRCHELGVHMLPNGVHGVRAVLHRDVSDDDVGSALDAIGSALLELRVDRSA